MQKRKINLVKLRFVILIIFILFFVGIYIFSLIRGYGLLEWAKKFVVEYPKLSPAIYSGLYAISAFLPLPLLTMFGATIFSFWQVFIFSMMGNVINGTIIFYLAKWLGRDFMKYFEEKYETIKKLNIDLKKNTIRDMVMLRFFFVLPAEIGNFIGGLSEIKYRDFLAGILVGMAPVLFASILLVKGELTNNNLMLTIATILFILLILIPIVSLASLRKYSKEKIKHHYHNVKRHVENIAEVNKPDFSKKIK